MARSRGWEAQACRGAAAVAAVLWVSAAAAATGAAGNGVAGNSPAASGAGAAPADAAPLRRPALTVRSPQRAPLLAVAPCGADGLVAVGAHGVVLRSADGGQRWQQSPVPTSQTLTALSCTAAGRGWAVGHGGIVLVTGDGGRSWTRQLDGLQAAQRVREAASGPAAQAEAERGLAEGADKPLLDVLAASAQEVIAVGAYNLALRSSDGGASWQAFGERLPNPKRLHLHALAQVEGELLIAGEQGLLLHSDDAGRNFNRVPLPYAGSLFTVQLLDARTWLVAGLRGQVWVSRDAGVHWQPVRAPQPVTFVASAVQGADSVRLLDQAGRFFLWRRGAPDLEPLGEAQQAPASGFAVTGGGQVVGVGDFGLVLLGKQRP